ncbi:MAG: ATP-binding protein [Patescibacteria group bacterium]
MNKLLRFLKLKEMRLAKFFLVIFLIQVAIAFTWLPLWVGLIATAVSLVFLIWLSFNAFGLAKTNFALRLEKNQNHAIINSLSEGVIAYDQDFKIWSMNDGAEIICGIRREEVLDKKVTPEWAGNDKLKILAAVVFPSLAPVVVKKTVATYPQVVDISLTEPRELHLEVTTNQIFDESKNLLGFVKIIRDRSREIQLLKTKSEFITIAAHQLRTPLSGIHWAAESLANEELGPLTEEQKALVSQSLETIEKLIKMVDDLLDVSKIEEGKFGYQMEKADLVALAQEILGTYKEIAEKYKVKLAFYKPEAALPLIKMDKAKIMMVVQNLVDNAIKYNVENGEVKVRVEQLKDKPYVQVSVEDTGIGIPAQDLPRLFTKFFRSENTLKKETEGSGLGLFIVKNIIKRHGGDIWVNSIEKRGSTFSFVLPIDESLIPPVEIGSEEF